MRLFYKTVAIAAALFLSASAALAQSRIESLNAFDETSELTPDHGRWAEFLQNYIRTTGDNRTLVAYGAVSEADHTTLKAYLEDLQALDPTALARDEAFAYWVNLYNALTVDLILDNYPLDTIRQIWSGLRPGPWRRDVAVVKGVTLSLDDIEHNILRVFWSDSRVHYAVNCAAIGCPNLMPVAFTGANLEELLEKGGRDYVNHPRGLSISEDEVFASSIYNWFKVDFGGNDAGIIAHMKKYAAPELKQKLDTVKAIDRFDYDWGLNDAK